MRKPKDNEIKRMMKSAEARHVSSVDDEINNKMDPHVLFNMENETQFRFPIKWSLKDNYSILVCKICPMYVRKKTRKSDYQAFNEFFLFINELNKELIGIRLLIREKFIVAEFSSEWFLFSKKVLPTQITKINNYCEKLQPMLLNKMALLESKYPV